MLYDSLLWLLQEFNIAQEKILVFWIYIYVVNFMQIQDYFCLFLLFYKFATNFVTHWLPRNWCNKKFTVCPHRDKIGRHRRLYTMSNNRHTHTQTRHLSSFDLVWDRHTDKYLCAYACYHLLCGAGLLLYLSILCHGWLIWHSKR